MGYTDLKAIIDASIKTNGRQEITGSVLNGVMTNVLKGVDVLNRRNGVDTTGMSKVVLDKTKTFSEQVTGQNTIFEIRDSFDLGGGSVTIPSNSILHFNGGTISNGSINLNGALLTGDPKILCDVVPGHPARNRDVSVEWFGAVGNGTSDDSKHLLNASYAVPYVGGTLHFGLGKTYLHGDGISGDNGTGNNYSVDPNNPLRPTLDVPANVGRDITLRFLGYDDLTINGNGSKIVSNPNNGICKHNAVFLFGACNNLSVKDLEIDGNIKSRYENAGIQIGDYALGGSFGGYSGSIYNNWRNHTWVDSAESGYILRGNFYLYACKRVFLENIKSKNSLMDGFYISSVSGELTTNATIKNCIGLYNQRLALSIGGGTLFDIDGGEYSYSGYYENMTTIRVSSDSSGIGIELEEQSAFGDGCSNIEIHNALFNKSVSVGVRFSTGSKNNIVHHCSFINSQWAASYIANLAGNPWKKAENNELAFCYFYNGVIGVEQDGTNIHNNVFAFDKNFTGSYFLNHTDGVSDFLITNPIRFCDNIIRVDLTDIDSTFNYSPGYVNFTGNAILCGNYFENVYKKTGAAIVLCGQKVCNNRISASGVASTNVTIRPNYFLTKYRNCDLVAYNNSVNGFTTTVNINIEKIKYGTARVSVSLPLDSSTYGNERWYQLPQANAKIYVTSSQNVRYEIDVYFSSYYGHFRAVNYRGIDFHVALEAIVYYKNNTAYLKLKPTQESMIEYEMIGRRLNFAVSTSSLPQVLDSAPDVSSFNEMINLSKNNNALAFSNIDALLTGEYVMKDGKPRWANGSNGWVDADGYKSNLNRKGETSDRPSASSAGAGFMYFDTTLRKMIVSNGSAWVNMDGTALS